MENRSQAKRFLRFVNSKTGLQESSNMGFKGQTKHSLPRVLCVKREIRKR